MPAMAESVELAVKGTIIPAACVPEITGEVNYGYITAGKLSKTDFTVLDEKEVDFSIECDAPVKVAMKAINGRPGSVAGSEEVGPNSTAPSPVELLGVDRAIVAGLGTAAGKKIGGYAVGLLHGTLMADNNKMYMKLKDSGDSWIDYSVGSVSPLYYLYYVPSQILTYSWGESATVHVPTAIKSLSAKLVVQAYLNNTTELDTSSAIQLNGLTTIELVYL